jgi:hypothetical protein
MVTSLEQFPKFVGDLTKTSGFTLQLLSGVERSLTAHQQEGQQPDNLCGPYWVGILLKSLAALNIRGDQIALLADSILLIANPALSVPPCAINRLDYQVELAQTTDVTITGTSVPGLIKATELASVGQFALVPLSTNWTEASVESVFNICQQHLDWNIVPLCNIQTGLLWGSRLGVVEAITYLSGGMMQPPPHDWDVGHFVVLAGRVSGKGRSLMVIQDTYPVLGWNGYHLQPAEILAQALTRTDGSQGGMALFVAW